MASQIQHIVPAGESTVSTTEPVGKEIKKKGKNPQDAVSGCIRRLGSLYRYLFEYLSARITPGVSTAISLMPSSPTEASGTGLQRGVTQGVL